MKLHLKAPPDFSFLECVNSHGWKSLLPFSWDAESGTLSRVELCAGFKVTELNISSAGDMIAVDAHADVPVREIVSKVSWILQLDKSMAAFHDYCSTISELKHVPGLKQGRLLRSPTVFEDIIKVIATTNTTWGQTKGMVARLVDGFGSPLSPDSSRYTFPAPEQLASVPFEQFAEIARMGYRSEAVHKIATEIVEERLDVEYWIDPGIPSDDLYKEIIALPGIGPYAASCLMIYLGRYDRVNVDSWARTLVGKELGRKVTDKEVHEFFEPYGKWKALVYHFYPWRQNETEIK